MLLTHHILDVPCSSPGRGTNCTEIYRGFRKSVQANKDAFPEECHKHFLVSIIVSSINPGSWNKIDKQSKQPQNQAVKTEILM
jgi:hypothetical protein